MEIKENQKVYGLDEVPADIQFISVEQRMISKGEKTGQIFSIVKFLSGIDMYECMIFDNPNLITKLLKCERYKRYTAIVSLSQVKGTLKLSMKDIVV